MKKILLTAAVVITAISLSAQPQTKKQLHKWGESCLNRRNYECAETAYRKLLTKETDPRNLSLCLTNLGVVCAETGRSGEAMELYRAAVEEDPSNWRAWNNIANSLYQDERYTEALENYDKALANGAGNNVRRWRANTCWKLGKWEEAAADWQILMEANPNDHNSVVGYANAMLAGKEYEKAVEYTDRAIALDDSSASTYITRGVALFNMGRRNEAKESFEKAVSLGSDNPRLPGLIEKCGE